MANLTWFQQQQQSDDINTIGFNEDGSKITMKHRNPEPYHEESGTPHAIDYVHQNSESQYLERVWDSEEEEMLAIIRLSNIVDVLVPKDNEKFNSFVGYKGKEINGEVFFGVKDRDDFWHVGKMVSVNSLYFPETVAFLSFREMDDKNEKPKFVRFEKGE